MAKFMGITAKPFSHSIEGKLIELQRDFMVYVCNLSDMANPGAPPTQSTFKPRHDLQITIDESGYPFMPAAPSDDIIQTKTELARAASHISQQTLLCVINILVFSFFIEVFVWQIWHLPGSAAVHRSRRLLGQCSKFVDKQYLVPGLGIRDPNLFQKADLLSIIEHIRSRQATHGVEDTFRWKNVVDSSGELELSRYGYNAKAAKTKLASARQKARRKARKKSKAGQGAPEQLAQLDGLIPMPDDRQSRSPTPGQHDAAPAQDGAAMDPNIDPSSSTTNARAPKQSLSRAI